MQVAVLTEILPHGICNAQPGMLRWETLELPLATAVERASQSISQSLHVL
jgi:hypothetical protein